MASPPPPLPSPLLHLLTQLPITPKPEPNAAPNPNPNPNHSPNAVVAVTPELCEVLLKELAPSPDDDAAFADYLRLAQLQLAAVSARLRRAAAALPASSPLTPPPALGRPSSSQEEGSGSKKRARSAEMVRVSRLGVADHVHFRAVVRRARLTYEALRSLYHRQDAGSSKRNRPDLWAASAMMTGGLYLHRDQRIVGAIPGVSVGDAFFYRAELCVVGVHGVPQAGIDYVPASHVPEGEPIATSIISSGGYLDDVDSGDVLIYTGSGGRTRNNVKHSADQKLEGGNLALECSMRYGVEVRVIRGHNFDASPTKKVYVYDGLYKVVESMCGTGVSGCQVYRFKLVRIPGQEELGSKNWQAAEELKAKLDSRIRPAGYLTLDLSKGKERFRVPVCNNVDEERYPLLFEYIVRPEFPLAISSRKRGCQCGTVCARNCSCKRMNGGGFSYDENGILLRGRPVVYECGAACGCPLSCMSRVTQRGMKHQLEVFRSRETGWGVRTLDLILPGAFVCEYSGDVVAADQLDDVSMNEHCLIDPKRFPERWREWGDVSNVFLDDELTQVLHFPQPSYLLDVSRKRNVACYISHSCNPNVFVQFVIHGKENKSFPHLMVFAMETIPPMRELSIDYGS